ncbi:MAG: AAA family ATPase [Chloroflexi bacterium]|nr:AAA family ATPase [Chloroflexota bacterium]
MLTRLIVRRFKRFQDVDIELGNPVVFIGPNNSGKTAALQALALWNSGVKRWIEKRGLGQANELKRPGVAINRRDLIAIPVPNARLLWQNLHVRDVTRVNNKPQTSNIRIDVIVEGVTGYKSWQCGLEFDYANEESIYCRPLRLSETKNPERMPIPQEVGKIKVAYLPPMSGLAATEYRLDRGAIDVLIGEGRTAEVLRNICYILAANPVSQTNAWAQIRRDIQNLFGVQLNQPDYIAARGEITLGYKDLSGTSLDISSSGRGLQQTLLILAYLYANPEAVLLLDEPDAHLEVLRQRQIYNLITEITRKQGGQIIAASHSEVVLNEAADRDVVVAFVGQPHRIDDRGNQLLKALKEIGFEQYYQAEQTGWVLYLEGATDLAILQAFAQTLNHPAQDVLNYPFVHYTGNQPRQAKRHFWGLREAKSNLVGVAIFDKLENPLPESASPALAVLMWQRNEIENYLCFPETLMRYADSLAEEMSPGPLFASTQQQKHRQLMEKCIQDLVPPIALRNKADEWWKNVKASDEFLDRLFEMFFRELGLPNLMRKSDYHQLARLTPPELIDEEITTKLDSILETARKAVTSG